MRHAAIFMAIALGLALAVALLFPKRSELAPLVSIPIPLIATAIVITFATPRGEQRHAWARLGLGRLGMRAMLPAIVLPGAIAFASFAVAAAMGVVRFSPSAVTAAVAIDFLFLMVVFSVVFLGEEIGWRGYLLPRLTEALPLRQAALLTGLLHGVFHLPLYLLSSSYMSAGSRWIVVPLAMVAFSFGGVFYAWLRLATDSVWPVAVGHNAFNAFFATLGSMTVASSPAALAYVTNETGVVTVALIVLAAIYLLARAPVFRAEPRPRAAHRRAGPSAAPIT
jgi:membrane protease YdiL (CAAX protease family)